MNKFIEQELQKCKVAQIKQISDTEFLIEQKKEISYLIELN
jgi:hypothetical protein